MVKILSILTFGVLAFLYFHFGTISPCGILREDIRQHNEVASHLPASWVDAALDMKYGALTPGRCVSLLVNGDKAVTGQPTPRPNAPENLTNPLPLPATAFGHDPMTAQKLARCLVDAGNRFRVPPAVLIGIMQVEGGHIGSETQLPENGGLNSGPMQVNSKILPELSQIWGVNPDTAHHWVRDDGCVNINVAAWLLSKDILEAGDISKGIALYGSSTRTVSTDFTNQVIKVMDQKGLIKHDEHVSQLLQTNP